VVAGNVGSDTFGYYLESSPGTLHQLFGGGTAEVGTTVTVTFTAPPSNYGFYFQNGNTIFYSDATLNSPSNDPGVQHFALFQGASTPNNTAFWIGVEDEGVGGDYDYNDMIIRFDAGAATPEPVAWALMATVAIVLGIVIYRRRSSKPSANVA